MNYEAIKHNLPYILFVLLGLKLGILGASTIFDVLALFTIGLMVGFFELSVKNKKFQELSSKINELELKYKNVVEKNSEMNEKLDGIRTVVGIKQVVRSK